MRGVPILTTDYNLNRLARIQDVQVLNVNDLANALKPAVLPGERIELKLIREGKESEQAVGYLDDGTMVVVDNARKMISKTIEIVVTSVLQTTAGKMIFGRYIEVGVSAPHAVERDRPGPVQHQARLRRTLRGEAAA